MPNNPNIDRLDELNVANTAVQKTFNRIITLLPDSEQTRAIATTFSNAKELAQLQELFRSLWSLIYQQKGFLLEESTIFAKASWELNDSDLFLTLWDCYQSSKLQMRPHQLVALIKAAGLLQQAQHFNEIWLQIKSYLGSREKIDIGAIAKSAAQINNGPLIEELWSVCHYKNVTKNKPTLVAFAQAAAKTGCFDVLRAVWQEELQSNQTTETTIKAFLVAVSTAQMTDLLPELIKHSIKHQLLPSTKLSDSFKEAAQSLGESELLSHYAEISAHEASVELSNDEQSVQTNELMAQLNGPSINTASLFELAKTVNLASWEGLFYSIRNAKNTDVLMAIMANLSTLSDSFENKQWLLLVETIHALDQDCKAGDLWHYWQQSKVPPDANGCLAILKQAGASNREDWVGEVIDYISNSGLQYEAHHWLSILKIAVKTQNPALQSKVWQVWEQSNTIPQLEPCLKLLVAAAGPQHLNGIRWLLACASKDPSYQTSWHWVQFIQVAQTAKSCELLQEVWRNYTNIADPIDKEVFKKFNRCSNKLKCTAINAEIEEIGETVYGHSSILLTEMIMKDAFKGKQVEGQALRKSLIFILRPTDKKLREALFQGLNGDFAQKPVEQVIAWIFSLTQAAFESLDEPGWGEVINIVGKTKLQCLVTELWHVFVASKTPSSTKILGAFAIACIRIDDTRFWQLLLTHAQSQNIRFTKTIWKKLFFYADQTAISKPLLTLIWQEFSKLDISLGKPTWDNILKSIIRVDAKSLLKDIWCFIKDNTEDFGPIQWSFLISASASVGDKAMFNEIWESSIDEQPYFEIKTWASFAISAAEIGEHSLYTKTWLIIQSLNLPIEPIQWGTLAKGAGMLADTQLLTEIWQSCQPEIATFEGRTFGSFAKAAGQVGNKRLLKEVWQSGRKHAVQFDEIQLGTFAHAAGLLRDKDLLNTIWHAANNVELCSAITLGSFVNAAGNTADTKLVRQMWLSSQSQKQGFDSKQWGGLANAASKAGAPDLVRSIWDAMIASGEPLSPSAWGSFANAVGNAGGSEFLSLVWKKCCESDVQFDMAQWGSFANAAGNCGNQILLNEIWLSFVQSNLTPDSRALGSFANAAGRIGPPGLLGDIWFGVKHKPFEWDDVLWITFINSAGYQKDLNLLSTIWHSFTQVNSVLEPRASSAYIRALGINKQVTALTEFWHEYNNNKLFTLPEIRKTFINALEEVNHGALFEECLNDFLSAKTLIQDDIYLAFLRSAAAMQQDRLTLFVLQQWNLDKSPLEQPSRSFYRQQCTDIAYACATPAIKIKLLNLLDWQLIEQSTIRAQLNKITEHNTQPQLNELSLLFDALMRLLANYLLTNETDLVEQVTEWLALFVEKSQPQHQPQLLALLFNHTRLAFIEVHRQHYFESLQQISAVTPQKWSSLTNERQIDFIADINVSSSTGVLVRINEFLKRDINISSVSATSQIEFSEKVAAMVEKISNSQSVTEISSWDKELLMKEGHEFVEQWVNQAVFLHQVLNLFWNTSAKQVFSVLHRASHDILKAQCYDAALKLEKISTSDAECQLLGKHLWETINTFFLSFMHMEDEQLHTPKTLEIGRKILQVCHGSALEASWCTFDVPNNLFIQAWDNALETQLIPIFRELVANAQKALLRLPEQDRRFSLSAYIKGNYIEFEIANTMLADAVTANNFILLDSGTNQIAIPKSHMLGSGLNSIKQRIKKLKGIVDKTQFPEIVVDNKVLLNWKCRFLLPRSKEVT